MASNRVIGSNGQMPWHLSADLKRFKQITFGSPVIMGRKTFEAIGKPLPGRKNIIISRNAAFQQTECLTFADITSALEHCADSAEIFVIGGASLYQTLLPTADYIYLTEINKNFDGDTFFPEIDRQQWREEERQDITNDSRVDFSYRFLKLARLSLNN